MSVEPILEGAECWCRSNVGRQTVPHRRTSDGECPIAKTKSGASDGLVQNIELRLSAVYTFSVFQLSARVLHLLPIGCQLGDRVISLRPPSS